MLVPSVALAPPIGWVDASAELARPTIGEGAGASLTQWDVHRSGTSPATLVRACVATPIPGWTEELRPTVEARTAAFTVAMASRLIGAPAELHAGSAEESTRWVGPAGSEGPRLGTARTFVGFGAHEVVTCFALCAAAAPPVAPEGHACDASVRGARLEGDLPPPAAGLVLGATTWAIHHPGRTIVGAAVVTFALGMLAVVARRRPRSRI